jgi:hypothetical protein
MLSRIIDIRLLWNHSWFFSFCNTSTNANSIVRPHFFWFCRKLLDVGISRVKLHWKKLLVKVKIFLVILTVLNMTNYFVILSKCISQSDYLSFVKLTLKTCQYEYAHLVNMMKFLVVMTFFFLSNCESWLVNKIMCNDQNDEHSSHYDLQ